jgi:hypothetical protein
VTSKPKRTAQREGERATQPPAAPVVDHYTEGWGRLPKPGQRFWGLSRTTVAEMCERGEIKSCVIKKRGAVRGIRLIFLPSLREHLERLARGGPVEKGGTK